MSRCGLVLKLHRNEDLKCVRLLLVVTLMQKPFGLRVSYVKKIS